MSITKREGELSTVGAIPLLIGQLADYDQHARALIHLFSLIDSTSDEERHFVINTAIEQAFARTGGGESIEAMLMEMARVSGSWIHFGNNCRLKFACSC